MLTGSNNITLCHDAINVMFTVIKFEIMLAVIQLKAIITYKLLKN